ncbi:MAG: hypothetical protein CMJ89_03960 [Planctomycetes bacterium]|jgi:hypothetical protein|nr:hypothetical protein [Planctomycetota bacterium]
MKTAHEGTRPGGTGALPLFLLCSFLTAYACSAPTASSDGRISEQGRERITSFAADQQGWGEPLCQLETVPQSAREAEALVLEAVKSRMESAPRDLQIPWPDRIQISTQFGGHFFLSVAGNEEGARDYDTGYKIDGKTGAVYAYHIW